MQRSLVAALGAVPTVASSAFAATLNPDGTGFVGTGEVQTVLGWSNARRQSSAAAVGFALVTEETRTQECVDMTVIPQPGGQPLKVTLTEERTQERELLSHVAFDPRTNRKNQVTGFNLRGFGATAQVGGDETGACPAGYHPQGSWSDWVADAGTLYVVHNGQREALSF